MEDDLKLFEDCFGIPLTIPINVRKQVCLNSNYFSTFPVGGLVGGWVGGRLKTEIKTNTVQFQMKLPV